MRIMQEIEMLTEKYSSLQNGENLDWMMIPDFPLPEGWNTKKTKLLILIPPTYPHTAPDNFYVESSLRLTNGELPASYSEGSKVPVGDSWGCFSWHSEKWGPSDNLREGDNLLSFIKSVNIRLREGK